MNAGMTNSSADESSNSAPKLLRIFLRFQGFWLLVAVGAVVMPAAWMDQIHQWLGLGSLPEEPIVGYLARSTSALYAIHGAVTLFVTFDLNRYRPLVGLIIALNFFVGIAILAIDIAVGMPWWWSMSEGPGISVFALFCGRLWLGWRPAKDEVA